MTQNGLPFALGRRADGWFGAERGSFEFMIKPGSGGLRVDLGAGRVLTFKKLGKRKAVPAGIAGIFSSPDTGATWHVRRGGADTTMAVYGPLVTSSEPWSVNGIDGDTVEIVGPGDWIKPVQLAHLERDKAGKIAALVVSSGPHQEPALRTHRLRFFAAREDWPETLLPLKQTRFLASPRERLARISDPSDPTGHLPI